MLSRLQVSIQILKEATLELIGKIRKAKKEEFNILHDLNKKKDEDKIKDIKNKLGI